MAANRGVTVFVLLLYCCHRAEQPARNTSDEILVQEILNPNKSSRAETSRTAATISTTIPKRKDIDSDGNQIDSEGYHELSENQQISLVNEEKTHNNVSSANDSYQVSGPEEYGESHLSSSREDRIFHNKKNNSKINHHEHLSILDKILKKIGKFSGNLSRKLKKTKEARRAESGQHDHKLREISVKQEILTE
uniref:Sperm acrosome associated 7 n=1 Tax=Molossus molossus TaxID=27622 RepID=A0A7J8GM69_MOLMO|nr:sperm acrosome associated 7 [Molossus molossus]